MKTRNIPVAFTLAAPAANEVWLVGEFTGWEAKPRPLARNSDGLWHVRVTLKPGRHEYRFLVDGQWQNDPACPACVTNVFGTVNNVIEVQ